MRGITFVALLLGCATAPPHLREGETIEPVTPEQVEQAFRGRAACEVYPEDGACETIAFLETSSRNLLVFRGVAASDIDRLTTDDLAGVVWRLQMFARYEDLFRRLAAERAQGEFRYLKTVTMSRGVLNATENRWCTHTSPGENFESVDYYFSNNLSADTSADVRLSPESERAVRTFLRELAADEEFRAIVEATADTPAALEEARQVLALFAGTDECWSYTGIVRGGRVELTSVQTVVNGRALPSFARAVRLIPLSEPLGLRAN